jgi:hypothetical protein
LYAQRTSGTQAILAIGEVMGERGLKVVLRQVGMERYVDELPPNDLEQGVSTTEYAALNAATRCGAYGVAMTR